MALDRLQYTARGVARVLAARPDPARVLLLGRCGASVFYREPENEGTNLRTDGWTCGPARVNPDLSRNFSSLTVVASDLLHLRGHTDADRIGLRPLVSAGIYACANTGHHAGADLDFLLDVVRALS